MRFQNPANGYVETVTRAGEANFWAGPFYFASKGVWSHAVMSTVLGIMTFGVSALIYPYYAQQIMRTHYLRMGWIELSESEQPDPPTGPRGGQKQEPSRVDQRLARYVPNAGPHPRSASLGSIEWTPAKSFLQREVSNIRAVLIVGVVAVAAMAMVVASGSRLSHPTPPVKSATSTPPPH